MTTLANLSNQGTGDSGVTWNGTNLYTFDITDMNAVITAYNAANSTSYPTFDTTEDNFEKLVHFIMLYAKIQHLALGQDTFNILWTATSPQQQTMGTRGLLSGRAITLFFPFSSDFDVEGDSDNLG